MSDAVDAGCVYFVRRYEPGIGDTFICGIIGSIPLIPFDIGIWEQPERT